MLIFLDPDNKMLALMSKYAAFKLAKNKIHIIFRIQMFSFESNIFMIGLLNVSVSCSLVAVYNVKVYFYKIRIRINADLFHGLILVFLVYILINGNI